VQFDASIVCLIIDIMYMTDHEAKAVCGDVYDIYDVG
jgi:hypothetical protein